ncbi:MBL fold metallo-hydrolase [uncultured Desulfosarcina sp.]|uniref:MBL fold metallo-hydrolase n=1 Tax=uncultured Desulfosarcina sp. TaxID=218289 RepID=UPI0029C955EF|nr:MBL fold metallo-hydrolase [uncultured Desulfosarcina sp.]
MRLKKPGRIRDNLWFLGWEDSCVYLLVGRDGSILINGGVSGLVPDLLAQFDEFGIDASHITAILCLHSHFDHVGILPYFKRLYPQITIYASARARKLFTKPKITSAINEANRYVIENRGLTDRCRKLELEWEGDIECETIGEGDRIDLGDLEILIYETPGHSPCSISAYVPRLNLLFPSEAGGLPWRDKIITYGTSNFSEYERSLRRLNDLEVSYLCSDHFGCVTGDEARDFIGTSIQEARWRRRLMEAAYQQTGSVAAAGREMALVFQDENAADLVPRDLFVAAHHHMVKHVIHYPASR